MSRHSAPSTRETGSWPRYLATGGIVLALYATAEWVVPAFRARPGVLVVALLAGSVIGILVAAWQRRFSQPRSDSQGRRLRTASAGLGLAGLCAVLGLERALTAESAQWMLLGLSGLITGAAGHAWFRDRRRTIQD